MSTTGQPAADLSAPRIPMRDYRWLSLGAVAGPLLFVLCWLVLGPTRPGYSSVSQPVSALAVGPEGASMRVAFLLNGLLVTVGVIAASRAFRAELRPAPYWAGLAMLLISPLGVVWDGIFTMDHLALHNIGVQAAAGSVIVTLPLVGLILRRTPSWRRFGTSLLFLAAPLTVALLIGFMTSVPLTQMATGGGHYGLWQRALTIEAQAWYAALGWLAFRRPRESVSTFSGST